MVNACGLHATFRVNNMTNFFRTLVRDEAGASAAEYALILVVVGAAIAIGASALSGAIGSSLNQTATLINSY
jgi:pilus assembly protein Flp/PilA